MQSNIDELPIGSNTESAKNASEEMKSSAEVADKSGPLEERLVSKNWSVRADAFGELNIKFKGALN